MTRDHRIHVYSKVECPVCHRDISVSKARVMRPHASLYGGGQCPGAGRTYPAGD